MTVATGTTFPRVERAGIPVRRWSSFDGLGVDAVVTTRSGGVSRGPYASLNLALHVGDEVEAVHENRSRAAAAVHLALDDLVFANQVHGRAVVMVGSEDRGRGARTESRPVADADALVTATPGVGLVVMVADCVPIVLVDPVRAVLACVHAGWRGTVAGVTRAAVDAMAAVGSRPADLHAGIGPAIAASRYQVGADVADAAHDAFGRAAADVVVPDGTGAWRFDLVTANRVALRDAGVRDDSVAVATVDTGDEEFFSDRWERPCGRFGVVAVLVPERATR